ncbi:MAG TPA: M1 family metallopeptidase [Puia sp.]|uniref:M1 family metallopeptidase n=1 Tax=Puia sp. TaxID=2045100 RepID=UPI002BEF31F3|nr:M1 family metallopeptidase [Puia sp.]HVU97883.1 M1 family metallopeptidase [Puia sp.]
MSRLFTLVIFLCFFSLLSGHAQLLTPEKEAYSHADSLRGSIGPERAWWDLLKYELQVEPSFDTKSLKGTNAITFAATSDGRTMQIDLQEPMQLTGATWKKRPLKYTREGNVFHLEFPKTVKAGSVETIVLQYQGVPKVAVRPPWGGGWIWNKDEHGRPWMTVADEGLGLSSWLPCKDHLSDEPDSGVVMHIVCPDSLMGIGNGRLREKHPNGNGTTTYTWVVTDPINSYDIIPYIGKYVNWTSVFDGAKGKLDCSFWVLDYNLEKAKPQFKQADTMLRAFEYWMGPYPFYEDGYKLVEAPHLGMEHQSNIAYGNHFANGYLGRDLSGTGWGLKWDFIIVHESGHEWFGNNITDKDAADMWVHEGFTNYSETLYTTYLYGVEAGNEYCIGTRKNVTNDNPIIGVYGVNKEGSGDMYYKGGNMLHMIRQIVGDSAFRGMLHGLQSAFYHKTVTTQEIENYISSYAHRDLSKVFDQYLRTTKIPVLSYQSSGDVISYRWGNCVKGFNMPVKVYVGGLPAQWIYPTDDWQTMKAGTGGQVLETPQLDMKALAAPAQATGGRPNPRGPGPGILTVGATGNGSGGDGNFSVDRNFYIVVRKQN